MQRLPNVHQRLVLALLVGIVAVPITSTALFINQTVAPVDVSAEDIRQSAIGDRSRLRAQRRMYWQVMERMEAGEIDINKPDINDTDALQEALDYEEEVVKEEENAEEITLTARELNTQDRGLLRRYTRAGFCPEGLKNFRIPGFYGLCVSLVGAAVKSEPVVGLLNHNANLYRTLRGSAPDVSGFKLRMQMIEQANNRDTRRDDTTGPARPKVCIMNPTCHLPRFNN